MKAPSLAGRESDAPDRNDRAMAIAGPVLHPYRFSRAEYDAIAGAAEIEISQ